MGQDNESNNTISITPVQLAGLLLAVAAGGGGVYGYVGPQIERSALQACYDNSNAAINQSTTALSVAAQHGEEFVVIRQDITKLDDKLNERTKYRWTAEDQARHEIELGKQFAEIYRRVVWLEERVK